MFFLPQGGPFLIFGVFQFRPIFCFRRAPQKERGVPNPSFFSLHDLGGNPKRPPGVLREDQTFCLSNPISQMGFRPVSSQAKGGCLKDICSSFPAAFRVAEQDGGSPTKNPSRFVKANVHGIHWPCSRKGGCPLPWKTRAAGWSSWTPYFLAKTLLVAKSNKLFRLFGDNPLRK